VALEAQEKKKLERAVLSFTMKGGTKRRADPFQGLEKFFKGSGANGGPAWDARREGKKGKGGKRVKEHSRHRQRGRNLDTR